MRRTTFLEWPEPSQDELARSRRLKKLIRADIDAAGGWLRFDDYMQRALYEPGLGYYTGPGVKFGPGGDFVTAPELGDFLARALAERFAPVLRALERPAILEVGAGSGRLARALIGALEARRCTPIRYFILETSASLRTRQRAELEPSGADITWLDALPRAPFDGVIFANEVVDAMPVARFLKQAGRVRPLGVTLAGDGFDWAVGPADERLAAAVDAVEQDLGAPLPDGYRSELSLRLPGWLAALSAALGHGLLLLIDYGLVRREYYDPARSDGTLLCHYRHRAHGDPFLYPGLQDISAWVDFSACAQAARGAGLAVGGFTTQAQFLLSVADVLIGRADAESPARLADLKTLLLPGEMGERFKLMLLTKECPNAVLGGRDFRSWL
jgi:SAM-dependent MidA family methyltransferase